MSTGAAGGADRSHPAVTATLISYTSTCGAACFILVRSHLSCIAVSLSQR